MTPTLIRGRIEHIRIPGIHEHFVDPGVIADVENAAPALAAIGGLIKPPVAPGTPERPLGRDIDGVGIAGIDHDHADVLGLLQSHVLP